MRDEDSNQIDSPEALDYQLKPINNKNWLVLIGLSVLLVGIIVWSIFGRIYIRAEGLGIIIPSVENTSKIVSHGHGVVLNTFFNVGDYIKRGDILAVTNQEKTINDIKLLNSRLDILVESLEKTLLHAKQHKGFKEEQIETIKTTSDMEKKSLREYHQYLTSLLKQQQNLFDNKYIAQLEYEKNKRQLGVVSSQISSINEKLSKLNLLKVENNSFWYDQVQDLRLSINETKSKLNDLYFKLEQDEFIISPDDGLIVSLDISKGEFLTENEDVAVILQDASEKYFLAFFSPTEGKKVTPGMLAYIVPSIVKRDIDGSIISKVISISPYPLSFESIAALLPHSGLATELLKTDKTAIYAKIKMDSDGNTKSGFAWTSKTGPDFKITSGSIGSVSVVVKEIPPIIMAFKFLKGLSYDK